MKRYYWTGISTKDRLEAISEITTIVSRHATLLNFQKYSDISLNLILETEETKLNDLRNELQEVMLIEKKTSGTVSVSESCIVLLSITFTKGTGDLLLDIPDIPE